MNKTRRKALEELLDKIAEIRNLVEAIKDEEEEYRDNIPENLQGSKRYETAEAACDVLCEAVDLLEEAANKIEEVVA